MCSCLVARSHVRARYGSNQHWPAWSRFCYVLRCPPPMPLLTAKSPAVAALVPPNTVPRSLLGGIFFCGLCYKNKPPGVLGLEAGGRVGIYRPVLFPYLPLLPSWPFGVFSFSPSAAGSTEGPLLHSLSTVQAVIGLPPSAHTPTSAECSSPSQRIPFSPKNLLWIFFILSNDLSGVEVKTCSQSYVQDIKGHI